LLNLSATGKETAVPRMHGRKNLVRLNDVLSLWINVATAPGHVMVKTRSRQILSTKPLGGMSQYRL